MSDYHPRRKDRELQEAGELTRLLKQGKFVVIAMARDGEPYVVTLSYGYDEANRRLYFHCAPRGEKLEVLRSNPKVCATIIEDRGYLAEQCEHAYSSLVLRGEMRIVEALEEKKHGLEILLEHLEENPEPILKRNIANDGSYDKVAILRLDISSLVGKSNA